ncbi:MAG: DNA polymerase III subunit beta [Anaerolineae bacterium]|nr:DNA polymerase III subunit beta [Anaerolineae bacterium]
MKLSCLQENISKGLGIVGRAVPSRTTMPILGNVLLATDHGQLKLAATNLELSVVNWVGARVETDGAVTVPARNFIDLVNSLPQDQVDLTLDEETLSLALTCSSVKASFRGISAEEFPMVPEPQEGDGFAVESGDLRKGLVQVTFAASTDDSHPVLTGVLAEFNEDTLTLAAADGFRLSVQNIPLIHPVPQPFSVIIPARALSELMRIIGNDDEPLTISTTRQHNQILFQFTDTVLNSQLIDGNFPDYRRIIPPSHGTTVVFGREELLQACKRAAIFAREAANIVTLAITPGQVLVTADSAESGQGSTTLMANVEGGELEIAFNVRFMIDVLSALDTPQVALELNTPTSPGVIKAIGDDAFIHVVMPMHLGRR